MFHGMFVWTMFFTICLCISPDLDGYQGTKNEKLSPERPTRVPMFHDMFVYLDDTGY